YSHNNLLASLTFFLTKTNNFIGRDWSNLGEYVNLAGQIESTGYELEFNYLLNTEVKLFANYSHAESETYDGMSLNDIPQNTANIGVLWGRFHNWPIQGSAVFRWLDKFTASQSEFEVDGYSLIDLNLEYSFNSSITAEIQFRNM